MLGYTDIDIVILYLAMSRARVLVYCSVIQIPGVMGTLVHLDEYYDMFTVLHKLEKTRLVEIIEHYFSTFIFLLFLSQLLEQY